MAALAAVIIAVAMLLPMTPGMVARASPTPLQSMPSGAIRSDGPRSDLAGDPPADVRGEATFSPRPALNLYYQWVGVATDPMTGGLVQGIGSTVDVRPASVPCAATGFANFDRSSLEISVTSSVYANVGFFLLNSSIGSSACSTSGPYPYYRDASGNFQVVCSGGTLADGPHSFNATAVDGSDVWAFTVDGAAIRGVTYNWTTGQCDGPSVDGQMNLANATATLPSLWSALKEETTDPNQSFWPVPAFRFPTAFSVSNGQHWSEVAVGLTTRVSTTTSAPAFGVEGELQNSSLVPDEIRVGDGIPWPSGTSVLWAPPLEVRVEVAPVNGSAPLAVTCSAVISGGTGSYPTLRWAFGDGSTETSATPRHVYGSAGRFEVSLVITDSQGERANSTPVVVHVTEGSGAPSARPGVSPELIAAIAGASVAILGIVVLWRWKHRGRPR